MRLKERHSGTAGLTLAVFCCLTILNVLGCTSESTRVAIESQRRADQVQQAVFDQQREALRVLLYRDLVGRLQEGDATLSGAQRGALSEAWNERDLMEFWSSQHERARALRMIGVDAKLFSDQSIVDLLFKSVEAKIDRAQQGLATLAGEKAAEVVQARPRAQESAAVGPEPAVDGAQLTPQN